MDRWEIEERVNQGYYQPERRQIGPAETPEYEEIQQLKIRITQLQAEIDKKKKSFHRDAALVAEQRLAEFKHDCLTACGLLDHPKREQAWEKAWERGRHDCIFDVYDELEELAELLR